MLALVALELDPTFSCYIKSFSIHPGFGLLMNCLGFLHLWSYTLFGQDYSWLIQ